MEKIVHVFPAEKFTIPFMRFAKDYLYDFSHSFIIYRNGGFDTDLHLSELFVRSDRFDYIEVNNLFDYRSNNWLKTANAIILHSFSPIDGEFFSLHRSLLKKSALVIWGGEVYSNPQSIGNISGKIKWRIKELLKRICFPMIPCFMAMQGDYAVAQRQYHARGKQYHVHYPSTVDVDVLDSVIATKKADTIVRVMIGNSSTSTNNHIDAMRKIAKYKDESIEVITPLSYGDKTYGDNVAAEGKRLFGDKYIAIRTFMSPEEYTRFLATIDIAIFNNNRQQGVGNIELLTYLGAKIYMRTDTSMWKSFQEDGLQYYDVSDIEALSFMDFCTIPETIQKHNSDLVKDNWDNYKHSLVWEEIINYMLLVTQKRKNNRTISLV